MKCPLCHTEIPAGYDECFFCGASLDASKEGASAKGTSAFAYYKDYILFLVGSGFAAVSIYYLPILFSLIGMAFGASIMKGHRKALGLALIIISFFCLTIGTLREI